MATFDIQLIHKLQEKFETLQQKITDKTEEIESITNEIGTLNVTIEKLSGEKDSKQLILNTLSSEKTRLICITRWLKFWWAMIKMEISRDLILTVI